MAKSPKVERAVAAAFPAAADRQAVLQALKRFDGPEATRVRLAIIVLAQGDAAEVEKLVKAGNEDYRDILYWAEYPEDSGTGTRREMAERYRALGIEVPEDLR